MVSLHLDDRGLTVALDVTAWEVAELEELIRGRATVYHANAHNGDGAAAPEDVEAAKEAERRLTGLLAKVQSARQHLAALISLQERGTGG